MKFSTIIVSFILCLCSPYAKAQNSMIPKDRIWYVTDFGAKGDGKTINTSSIQNAIDVCHQVGGGTVKITQGTYISGTLFLKDGVQLYLDVNAKICGSENQRDYQTIKGLNAKKEFMFGKNGTFLIYAENAKHISIQGNGEINGNGDKFWQEEMLSVYVRKPKEWRPNGLICFVNCQFINIGDIFLVNSPCYTLWTLGCDDVKMNGITIRNAVDGPNTDGIDVDCCLRVSITNCNIEGGDDAIAIKSDGGRLGEDRPCENVVVSNCILSAPPACAIRVGYEGDSPIKNCIFNNLAISKSHHGIDVVSVLAKRDPPFQMLKGTRIEGIQFNDIIMDDVIQPIYLWMGNEQENMESSVSMKNIRISNLTATNSGDSFIGSSFEKNIENINLSNIHVESIKSFPENTKFYNNVWGSKNPYTFYFQNISGLHINELCVDFSDSVEYWKHAVYFEKSKDVFLSNFFVKGHEKIKLISQIGVSNSSIQVHGFTKEGSPKFILADENSQIIIKN